MKTANLMSGIPIWTIEEGVEMGLVFGSFDKIEVNLCNYVCLSIGSFYFSWKRIWSIRQLNECYTIKRISVTNALSFTYSMYAPHPNSNPDCNPKTNLNRRLKLKLNFVLRKIGIFINDNKLCIPHEGQWNVKPTCYTGVKATWFVPLPAA